VFKSFLFKLNYCFCSVDFEKPSGIGSMENNFALLDGMHAGVEYVFEISTINCLGEGSAFPAVHRFSYGGE